MDEFSYCIVHNKCLPDVLRLFLVNCRFMLCWLHILEVENIRGWLAIGIKRQDLKSQLFSLRLESCSSSLSQCVPCQYHWPGHKCTSHHHGKVKEAKLNKGPYNFLGTLFSEVSPHSSNLLCFASLFCYIQLILCAVVLRDNACIYVWNVSAYQGTHSHSHFCLKKSFANAQEALWAPGSNFLSL